MLFREKIYLANCDSTRRLAGAELRKRALLGLIFADGVLVTPNILLDNDGFDAILSQRGVFKYLNEEGQGKLVIRGFGVEPSSSLTGYFESLPDSFVISSLDGAPTKGQVTPEQRTTLLTRLERLDRTLESVRAVFEPVAAGADLSTEIRRRLTEPGEEFSCFAHDEQRAAFVAGGAGLVSRSEWYRHAEIFFAGNAQQLQVLKAELLDPAYYSLFIHEREAFAQDRMRVLHNLPERLLVPGVMIRSLRREYELLQIPIKLFQLVSSLGSDQLLSFLTDQALDYLESRAQKRGSHLLNRRNWFGLYPKLQRYVGVEVK